MAERNNEDTRRYRRQTLRILVDHQTDSGVSCDYATTLGAGGMFLETEEALRPGMTIKVRFRLPTSEELHEIEGRVVWHSGTPEAGRPVKPAGAGIKFSDQTAIAKLARELEDYEL
jgi:Tfp pilus assembly protein PilZ